MVKNCFNFFKHCYFYSVQTGLKDGLIYNVQT